MERKFMFKFGILLILFGLTSCMTRNTKPELTESERILKVFEDFFSYCKNKQYDEAERLIAKLHPDVPNDYIKRRLAKYSTLSITKENILKIHIVKDKAVIVYMESKTDYDPVYFIQEKGSWKILIKLSSFKKDYYDWPEKTFQEFEELDKWFDNFKDQNLHK